MGFIDGLSSLGNLFRTRVPCELKDGAYPIKSQSPELGASKVELKDGKAHLVDDFSPGAGFEGRFGFRSNDVSYSADKFEGEDACRLVLNGYTMSSGAGAPTVRDAYAEIVPADRQELPASKAE